MKDHRIYFVQGGDGGPIKIGHASELRSRFSALQVGSPVILTLLAHMPGTAEDEYKLHASVASHRLHGEWFSPVPEVLALVEAARQHDQEIPPNSGGFVRTPDQDARDKDQRHFLQTTFQAALRMGFPDCKAWASSVAEAAQCSAKTVDAWVKGETFPLQMLIMRLAAANECMQIWLLSTTASSMLADRAGVSEWDAWKVAPKYPELIPAVWNRKTNEEVYPLLDFIIANEDLRPAEAA